MSRRVYEESTIIYKVVYKIDNHVKNRGIKGGEKRINFESAL